MKVKSIHNRSKVTVPVNTGDGITHLPPRATLLDIECENLDEVKKTCAVVENLNEVTPGKKGQRLND